MDGTLYLGEEYIVIILKKLVM